MTDGLGNKALGVIVKSRDILMKGVTAFPLRDVAALEQAVAERPDHYGMFVLDLLSYNAGVTAITKE